MKIRLSGVVAAAALAISTLVAASAQAAVFDFSYNFGHGRVATGVGEGTVQADGNTIDIDTIDSFTVEGQSIDPAIAVSVSLLTPPAIATFDGSFMDFSVVDPTLIFGISLSSSGQFASIEPPVGPGFSEVYDPAHWSITETEAAVPEPATWAMMGLGFAGICALTSRARRKATVSA